MEEGYKCHGNLYHNSTHAADVMQTVHRLIEAAQMEVKCVRRELGEVREEEGISLATGLLHVSVVLNNEGVWLEILKIS